MLNGTLSDKEELSRDEVKAIAAHLVSNVPEFAQIMARGRVVGIDKATGRRGTKAVRNVPFDIDEVQKMVSNCRVMEVARMSSADMISAMRPHPSDILFSKGKPAYSAKLILSGKVVVSVGLENYRVEFGPWSLLGAHAMMNDDVVYTADFTAFAASEHIRFLKITPANIAHMTGEALKSPVALGVPVSGYAQPFPALYNIPTSDEVSHPCVN
jgi:hypothetical protein